MNMISKALATSALCATAWLAAGAASAAPLTEADRSQLTGAVDAYTPKMNDAALKHLDRSEGWELGVGPSVVVVNEGIAKNLTTTTARDDVYAFVFGQEGLMLGLGIQGSKITRIQPEK